jgi:hypothetical protein
MQLPGLPRNLPGKPVNHVYLWHMIHRFCSQNGISRVQSKVQLHKSTVIFLVLLLIFFYLLNLNLYTTIFTAINSLRGHNPCQGKTWIYSDVGWIDVSQVSGKSIDSVCLGKIWEPHVAQAISRYLYGQGKAIDVGAFVGYHSIRMGKLTPNHKVYAIEGRESLHFNIERNVQRNNINNVHVLDTPELINIEHGWNGNNLIKQILNDGDKAGVSLIKIDCEGCELSFLIGVKELIERDRPVIILEIQDDEKRSKEKIGGQKLHASVGTRRDVINYLENILKYEVSSLLEGSWDYEAVYMGEK